MNYAIIRRYVGTDSQEIISEKYVPKKIIWVYHDIFIPMQGQIATTIMVAEITLAAIVWNIGHVS